MGEFPLFRAIDRGDVGAMKLLLDKGADPNIPDRVSAAEHYSLYAAKMQYRNRGSTLLRFICHKQHMYMYVHVQVHVHVSALQELQG